MKLSPKAEMTINLFDQHKNVVVTWQDNQRVVWDPIRKKRIVFQPEEFVRQLLIQYLNRELKIGLGRMVLEQKVNEHAHRFDLGIINKKGQFSLLVECKKYKQKLDEKTLFQLLNYNNSIKADYLMITNGKQNYCWENKIGGHFIQHIDELENKL